MNSLPLIITLIVVTAVVVAVIRRPKTSASNAAPQQPARDLAELTKHLFRESISIRHTTSVTRSYFGGRPPAASKLTWPLRQGRPLSFLACIDCAELPRCEQLNWLPERGCLLFFYDMVDQVWGFDPKDRGGAVTVYLSPEDVAEASGQLAPPSPLPAGCFLQQKHVAFTLVGLPPSDETDEVQALKLTDEELESLTELRAELCGEGPRHLIGGFPDPVQSPEMDVECQLVTHGLYCGDSSGYNDPRAASLRDGAKEWSLLLQMDSDDAMEVMWGDCGMIYFWVKRDEARKLDFSNTWLIQQCC